MSWARPTATRKGMGRNIFIIRTDSLGFLKWTGSSKIALRRLQRPLAVSPERAAWTCAAASPAFQSVWQHRCGRCRPLCVWLLKTSSPEGNRRRRLIFSPVGKKKDHRRKNFFLSTSHKVPPFNELRIRKNVHLVGKARS